MNGKEITNLEDLTKILSDDEIKKCLMEYMMLLIAKAEKFDEIEKVAKKKGTTIDDIKEILRS